ncbi:SanA/YdcF family protein [Hyalangium versicolor]|uniref:SanA/YdcF family protein n=1 Tax=Hyalangium versicolor TaxID=2861190 RepID=UPI001CCF8D92|nr:ElyC/SanA/YdcF family protein [Hyalangium versicolor]
MRRGLLGGALAVLGVLALSRFVQTRYQDRIVPLSTAPEAPVVLVFGAGLAPGGVPSAVLAQRLDTAIALWKAGKARAVLVSGDNSDRFHDETHAMRRYMLERGLPEQAVLGDDSGLSTYDSCVRAFTVFQVRKALLVTQGFHLPRALYIANSVGMDAWGVAADEGRPSTRRYLVREMFSRVLALAMVHLEVKPTFPAGRTAASQR